MTTEELLSLLNKLDTLKQCSNRSMAMRMWILLLYISLHEGETQATYTELLKWTQGSLNKHTLTLIEYGFIEYGEYEQYNTRPAKTIWLTKKGKEFIKELLNV